jgi:hypothetical protein
MAILVNMTLPEGVTIQMLDEVDAEMGATTNPPAGMIVHTAYTEGGRTRVVDVWESQSAFEDFGQNRLGPAIAKVSVGHGLTPSPPERTIIEVQQLIRGR